MAALVVQPRYARTGNNARRRSNDPELFVDGQRIAGFVAIFGGGATADPRWEQLTPVSGSSIVRSTAPCSVYASHSTELGQQVEHRLVAREQ